MSPKFKVFAIILIILSGFLGGIFSGTVFKGLADTAARDKEIIARSIHIIDKNGVRRAGITLENNFPAFYLNDIKGKNRAYIAIGPKGPLLVFKDEGEAIKLFLEAADNGSSTLGFLSGDKNPRIMLSYEPERGPAMGLFDENNKGKALISVLDGKPSFALLRENKKPVMAMINYPGEGSVFGIWDPAGKPKISLGLLNNKSGLFIYGKNRTGLYFRNHAGQSPYLGLLENGSPIWTATGTAPPPAPDMSGLDDIMRDVLR